MSTTLACVALNRFGLGARPGEAEAIAADPTGWLWPQATLRDGAPPVPGVEPADQRLIAFEAFRKARDAARQALAAAEPPSMDPKLAEAPAPDALPASLRKPSEVFATDLAARATHAVTTDAPFTERLVMFWSNHFAVSAAKGEAIQALSVPYENEAIRPHVCGRFADLLKATAFHPAMLLYLDAAESVGRESAAGQRSHHDINENYAREVMELHTLGVDGGYTQADVVQLALALTGITVDRQIGRSAWRPARHEPGDRVVLGRTFAAGTDQAGTDQAGACLDMLALHPKTAHHLCAKLAAQFCGDSPPPDLVAAMARQWIAHQGSLPEVYRVLLAAPAAWHPAPVKYKTPEEFVISAARALGIADAPAALVKHMRALSDCPFNAPAPTGYSGTDAEWLNPGAVVERIGVATALGRMAPGTLDAADLLAQVVVAPSSPTIAAVSAARTAHEALTLALASPEFQRR